MALHSLFIRGWKQLSAYIECLRAAENHKINRIGSMPIVNKRIEFLTTQIIGTRKSAYSKGYAQF